LPKSIVPTTAAGRRVAASLVVAGLLVPVLAPAAAGGAAVKRVTVGDNFFVRDGGVPTVRVAKGTKVRWVWSGKSLHNVKVSKGPVKFGSRSQKSGSYAKIVRKTGTYTLVCTVHGGSDQSMKLVVR
jgi:plastocyanin